MGDHLISPIVLIFKHIAHVCFFKHFHWIPHSITVLVEPPKVIMIICTRKQSYRWQCIFHLCSFFLKGKLGDFFLLAQSFYRPQTKTSFKRQFSPKSPEVGQKSAQRAQKSLNKDQVSFKLLMESTFHNSGLQATDGIHNSVLQAADGIHIPQFCPPSY